MNPTDSKLILLINECVRSLPNQAYEMAAELSKIANEIEAPETREKALRRFDEYVSHYKGLIDIEPPGVERSKRTRRPASRSSGELIKAATRPQKSEAKLELLQSDVSYDDAGHVPGKPAVELAQSDDFAPLGSLSKQAPPAPPQKAGQSSGERNAVSIVAEPSGQIDIISTEMTHEALSAPAGVRAPEPAPEASVEVSEPPNRWLFAVAGLSAALVSAALTWFLVIGPQRTQHSVSPEDLSVHDLAPVDLAERAEATDAGTQAARPGGEDKPPIAKKTNDGSRSIPAEDKQKPSEGQVLVRSEPPGATVLLDKQEVGVTPLILLDRTIGEDFKIELKLEGYKKGRKRVKWKDKDRLDIKVKLQSESDEAASTLDGADEAK